MKLTEKMSYLQGMLDGLDIDTSTKEGKLLVQMTEVMHEMVMCVDDLQTQVDELTEIWEKWKRIFTTQMIVIAAMKMITMILISTATSFMKYAVLIAVKQLFLMKV